MSSCWVSVCVYNYSEHNIVGGWYLYGISSRMVRIAPFEISWELSTRKSADINVEESMDGQYKIPQKV